MAFVTGPRARTLLADGALAVPLGIIMVVGTRFAALNSPGQPPDALTYLLVGLVITVLPMRRLLPFVTLAVVVVVCSTYLALDYPNGPILLAIPVAQYTVGSCYPVRRSLPAYVAGVLVLGVTELVADREPWTIELGQFGAWVVAGLAPWAVGTAVRLRRESVRAAQAEQRRDREYQERLRTAQDVHDIVGHGLAAISMQAGVALHVLDRSPEQAREMLMTIKSSSQAALDELRTTLAVFRASGDDEAQRAPPPGLDRLDALVQRTVEAGVPTELIRTGECARLPASVELTAYRIVQESLTNVLRHAGSATATVWVEHTPDALIVQVTDTGRGPRGSDGAGQGITGMHTRAGAVGGTVQTGPGPDGGFSVRAWLPVAGR
ncbi:MAG: sensor histidine kinase [Actinomycetota bacterium]|nr:sensor histidine kinase [Actinomycetota bacterium]